MLGFPVGFKPRPFAAEFATNSTCTRSHSIDAANAVSFRWFSAALPPLPSIANWQKSNVEATSVGLRLSTDRLCWDGRSAFHCPGFKTGEKPPPFFNPSISAKSWPRGSWSDYSSPPRQSVRRYQSCATPIPGCSLVVEEFTVRDTKCDFALP